jgi:diguanylate cyclase (GGDEF)-like protein
MTRTRIVPVFVALLGVIAVAAIVGLQGRAADGRDGRLRLANLKTELTELQSVPFQANAATGASPALARALIQTSERRVATVLDQLQRRDPVPEMAGVARSMRVNEAAVTAMYAVTTDSARYRSDAKQLVADAGRLLGVMRGTMGAVSKALVLAGRAYDRRASASATQATLGSAVAILLLVLAFAVLYRRSVRARSTAEMLAHENARLATASHVEARTDALTGLRNRRALADDLEAELHRPGGERELALALYDLDGFKQYNDTFGHPAGDVLLTRLGERLEAAVEGIGTAYRMGGDEFCVLTPGTSKDAPAVKLAADALCEVGDAFDIGCSYGVALVPAEASSTAAALRLADQRMYENKAGRSTASRQSGDVLLKVLSERNIELREHVDGVAGLAERTAERLGLEGIEVKRVGLAAELHDIGKTAIPDTILNKPGPLDAEEWDFMRRHTLIGERILLAAPSLAPVAAFVRSSHEWFDGSGYPDGLSGDEIPLGASIIAVCDAYDAMITERPYHGAMAPDAALAELTNCAGTQFHPAIVEAFCALAAEHAQAPVAA